MAAAQATGVSLMSPPAPPPFLPLYLLEQMGGGRQLPSYVMKQDGASENDTSAVLRERRINVV